MDFRVNVFNVKQFSRIAQVSAPRGRAARRRRARAASGGAGRVMDRAACGRWRLAFTHLRRRIATVAVTGAGRRLCLCMLCLAPTAWSSTSRSAPSISPCANRLFRCSRRTTATRQQIQGAEDATRKSIEKEAREQLGYAKPGEYVYVPPAPAKPGRQPLTPRKNNILFFP